ncbi:helicase SKI2W [Anopheles stephensi]|uniref:helicase SKI2W n=1 Tax=Anopheles stephensi TaxID=30069 RepID=UPI001658C228|nr:helicase SKI2W [Anopheles stephensi]
MSFDPAWLSEPPPIIEDTEDLLRAFILEPKIPIHEPKPYFEPRHPSIDQLYDVPHAPIITRIVPDRCPETGKVLDFVETLVQNAGSTAKNSMSLQREPTESLDSARGSASYFPFWPGGFDEPETMLADLVPSPMFEPGALKSCPPGFATGVEFEASGSVAERSEGIGDGGVIDLLSAIAHEDGFDLLSDATTQREKNATPHEERKLPADIDEESLLSVESKQTADGQVLQISSVSNNATQSAEWAEMIDISKPVDDFYVKIPAMAHRFPFELDIFQKQAILKLEEHNHVFVAAHTSAGKTVVAEYAIALSKKHMTKTIYTSPIKALSNQKYRDFKTTFQDVGLITGDIQIDPTASCLIMTTEILRSMLYCGSDITRDLEYVIFDEVHYITDSDRGHVWEEVLILLPDHVCIVMLSATVPNTIEFANWVGKTKKKRVWVVSTAKRPVPLEHYLYTGFGGKSKDDSFLIVNEHSQFLAQGYHRAKESCEARQAKNATRRTGGPYSQRQEQTLWVGLIDHLQKKEKLPVVAFTLSRNRCDNNAEALMSCDLTTAREKYAITSFFQQCLQRLIPPDRALPQVVQMQACLERGIGIHHSGILPILKEIVEMLFARGLVKILFATETFAMGVNMPARTVIFDSTRKFDGQAVRPLQPSEYTQMAGRAGRRGLDKTGTVIILCKQHLPTDGELKTMILGKPIRLESQFRLTYAMMLYLLRVELVSVENMMLHSFREFGKRQQMPQSKLELSKMQEKMSSLTKLSDNLKPLCEFYEAAHEYIDLWRELMPKQLCQPKAINELKVGRVVVVTDGHHYNKLGVLLSVSLQSHKDMKLVVLVLDHGQTQPKPDPPHPEPLDRGTLWHQMLSLAYPYQTFLPEGVGGHCVLTLGPANLIEVTKHTIKCDASNIIRSWENRLIPRFRDAPPSQATVEAVASLAELNAKVIEAGSVTGTLECVRFQRDLTNLELSEQLKIAQDRLSRWVPYTNIADFEHEFALVFDWKQLERKLDELKYQASYESMSLYPDYQRKLQVLQELKYIDEMQQVAMKGRVACEMGQNELMITELVMRNILTDLQPAEIAALLSSLVFQAKTDVQPKLTETLQKAEAQFREVENDIRLVERQYGVTDVCKKEELNFGLTEVVYEWARNKPFAEIMVLTDIKEGIIVRCIQQLNETLCNVKDAARIIGDPVLHSKMEEASNAIKRDIVFAASLYTSSTPIVIGEV